MGGSKLGWLKILKNPRAPEELPSPQSWNRLRSVKSTSVAPNPRRAFRPRSPCTAPVGMVNAPD